MRQVQPQLRRGRGHALPASFPGRLRFVRTWHGYGSNGNSTGMPRSSNVWTLRSGFACSTVPTSCSMASACALRRQASSYDRIEARNGEQLPPSKVIKLREACLMIVCPVAPPITAL